MSQILIVDDEPRIRQMLQRYLVSEGYLVKMAATTQQAKLILQRSAIDLVLLDLRLGNDDGLELLHEIRASSQKIGVIILTGKTETIDKIVGLELGADDYVTKPFHLRELHARIKTVLRRQQVYASEPIKLVSKTVTFAHWKMNFDRKYLEDGDGKECKLTGAEFKLLEAFVSNPQSILTRDQLLDMTAGKKREPFDRTIDTQVRRLRLKIEKSPSEPSLIKTIRGSGYIFTETVKNLL